MCALAAAGALRTLLYGVEPVGAATIVGVGAIVSTLSAVACVKPAWSAARVDPTVALHAE